MAYQLRDGLSYCEAGQQAIFLDIECDRYFQLPEALTKLLVAHRQGMHTADIETLLRANIVVETRDTHDLLSPCPVNLVERSVLESSSDPERMATSFIPEVLAWICMTKWQLGRQRLGTVLRGLPRPQKGVPIVDPISGSDSNRRYFQAAIAFMRARRFVPIETNCLLDSLALMRFLSRRNLPAMLVFGVIPDPFSAHCWVQAGRLALNDSAGNINAHTPIRTVP